MPFEERTEPIAKAQICELEKCLSRVLSKLLAEETRSIHSLIFTLANEIDPRLNSIILTYYVDTICLEYHRFLTVEATCLRCVS